MLWGTGRGSGLVTVRTIRPLMAAAQTSLAPFAGAALARLTGGYSTAFLVLAAIITGAALLSLATQPESTPKKSP